MCYRNPHLPLPLPLLLCTQNEAVRAELQSQLTTKTAQCDALSTDLQRANQRLSEIDEETATIAEKVSRNCNWTLRLQDILLVTCTVCVLDTLPAEQLAYWILRVLDTLPIPYGQLLTITLSDRKNVPLVDYIS